MMACGYFGSLPNLEHLPDTWTIKKKKNYAFLHFQVFWENLMKAFPNKKGKGKVESSSC